MVGRVTWAGLLCLVGAAMPVAAQDAAWTLVAKGNLTTSSQIYDSPNSPDPFRRSAFLDVTDFFGYGVELKYQIPETHVAVGISLERVRARLERPLFESSGPYIPIEDGYTAVPIELTGYFIIPASGTTFGVFMGGGLGVYLGQRNYSWAGTPSELVDSKPGFGIHVLAGVSARFAGTFSLIGEMKFRDLQFQSTNRFSASTIDYQGTQVHLPTGSLDSNVHTDGITFQIGLAFSF